MPDSDLTALAPNCTLRPNPAASSGDLMAQQSLDKLALSTWVGHPSSVAQRVFERLNADSSSTGQDGNPILYGKVAVVGVVGNEDGAHKVTADSYQALNDVGFSIPAQGGTYWNGEAMHTVDYNELDQTPEVVDSAMSAAAANAAHLANALKSSQYTA